MVKIEVLFPEICNYFGNMYNIKYLEKNIPDVEVIYTSLKDTPKFVSQDVDMIYMAPMTEKRQHDVIEKLKPYTDRIKELIEQIQSLGFFKGKQKKELQEELERLKHDLITCDTQEIETEYQRKINSLEQQKKTEIDQETITISAKFKKPNFSDFAEKD